MDEIIDGISVDGFGFPNPVIEFDEEVVVRLDLIIITR